MNAPYRPRRIEPSGIQPVDLAVRAGNRIERFTLLAAGIVASLVIAGGIAIFLYAALIHSAALIATR